MSGYCEYKDAMQSISFSPLLEQLAKRALGLYEEFNRPAKYLLEELPKEMQSLRQYDFSTSFDFRKYTDGKGGLKSLQANNADKAALKFKGIYVYAGRANSKTRLIKDIAKILDEPEPPLIERLRQAEFQQRIEEAEKAARLRGTVKVSKPDDLAALAYSFYALQKGGANMGGNLKTLVFVKCIDGKERLKVLENIYCKHYKFDKGCFQGGCCFGSKKYEFCPFSDPQSCKHFELKKDARFKQA